MKLAPGVELIETEFSNRPLNLVLFVGEEVALVDSGMVGIPTEYVFPYLKSLDLIPEDISLVINTHHHADHIGGNHEVWLASGKRARFAAHRLEKWLIEDPANQGSADSWGRYVTLGVLDAEAIEEMVKSCGQGVRIDHTLDGGERFDLGDALELEIIASPGHSAGNISVLERRNGVLIHGESVGGDGQYDAAGKLLTVPFYENVETYLQTLAHLAEADFQMLIASHFPPMDRQQAAAHFEESLDFTLRFDAEVQRRVRESHQPVGISEIRTSMDNLWGQYPGDFGMYLLVEAHLRSLLKRGLITGSLEAGLSWQGNGDADLPRLVEAVQAGVQRLPR